MLGFAEEDARGGGFGRHGAGVAIELSTASLMKARQAGCDAQITNHLLIVDGRIVLGFARNAGMYRLQLILNRLDELQYADARKVIVLGAPILKDDEDQLTKRDIGVAWAIQWSPTPEFDGTAQAREVAPWLFG